MSFHNLEVLNGGSAIAFGLHLLEEQPRKLHSGCGFGQPVDRPLGQATWWILRQQFSFIHR